MDLKLAVLIDGDNIPSAYVKEMMEEIAKYGNPTIKRIYGDWTKPHLAKWKNILLENAITPIQQYGYTTGKNATDSAMIIDAMDILYSEKVNGFCLVSSDSDFTRLATRLREAGMTVFGLGEKKTPDPFIVACDKFIYIEILKQRTKTDEKETSKEELQKSEVDKITPKVIKLIA
ncbi:MAG TPA: NYN domain-containing protein, partial [Anditalea sp.]|nr:NYN domain-containing protein [Anditalea sp.]